MVSMLIKLITGLSAAAAAVTTFTVYMAQPFYNQIWILLLLFLVYLVGIVLAYVVALFVLTELTVDMDKPQDEPSKFWVKQLNALAEAACTVFNIKVHVTGLENVPRDERFLLVCNHKSMFDPIVKIPVFKDYDIIYASKAENFKIPIGGKIMHKTGCLVMDRENNREALKTIMKMTEFVKNGKHSACIYPEGTRNKGEGLLPFHAGSFKVAQRAGAPVVVVALRGTDKAAKGGPFKKSDVYIDVVKVIDGEFAKSNSTQVTAEIARNAILEKINESEKNDVKETVAT